MEKQLKIIADDKIPFLRGALEPFANIAYLPGAKITADDVSDADALFTRTRTRCDAALLDGSRLKLIVTATIGYDHIDTAWCDARHIRWMNAPGCNSSSVQQYITAALATLEHDTGRSLNGLTLGVIGVGNVGGKVAKAGEALGMRVVLNDPPRADREGTDAFTSLDDLLAQSDVVTCHVPLTKTGTYPTFHLADDSFFERMKTGAAFINSSRGEVVDSSALKRAAKSQLSHYILDVWENEPHIDRELLDGAFIATPHIAGYSADGKANGTAACVRELLAFFDARFLPADWYPAVVPPPPMPTKLTVDSATKTDRQILQEAIVHAYPVKNDSLRLKQSPETFEEQRGNYWTRREFTSFTLTLDSAGRHVAKALQKLGFTVVTDRNTLNFEQK